MHGSTGAARGLVCGEMRVARGAGSCAHPPVVPPPPRGAWRPPDDAGGAGRAARRRRPVRRSRADAWARRQPRVREKISDATQKGTCRSKAEKGEKRQRERDCEGYVRRGAMSVGGDHSPMSQKTSIHRVLEDCSSKKSVLAQEGGDAKDSKLVATGPGRPNEKD